MESRREGVGGDHGGADERQHQKAEQVPGCRLSEYQEGIDGRKEWNGGGEHRDINEDGVEGAEGDEDDAETVPDGAHEDKHSPVAQGDGTQGLETELAAENNQGDNDAHE